MPAVANNALTIATGAARSAARANNAAQSKDSDDTSFSDLLTEQSAPEKTDASSKGNSAAQTRGRPAETKSSDAQSPGAKTPHLLVVDGKSAGKKADSVKQHQRDAKNDSTDGSDQPDVNTASNIQDKLSPISNGEVDSDAADPDPNGNNTGIPNPDNQNQGGVGQEGAGKDAVTSADAITPAAPDPGTAPPPAPVQQANTDAMAQAATASMQVPIAQTFAPASPSGQDIASGSIGTGRSRPRMPDLAPQQPSPPQTIPDTDSDSDPTATDAATTGSASAAAPLQAAATVPAPSNQDDSDPDQDDAPDVTAAASTDAPAPQPAANAPPSLTIAPPPAPPSRSGAPAPHTLMAQNNKPAPPDTTSPATPSVAATSKDNQPLNPDDTVSTTQTSATRPPKTLDGDFKFAAAKAGDQQSADAPARADADSNVPAPSTPAPLPPQSPTPGPVSPTIALANAGVGTSPALSGGSAPAITANIHIGPQTTDVTPNVNSLAVEIAAKSQSGAKQFDIRLDPPELGRVEVRLSIDASGKAEAHMTADQPQTLHLLQKDSDTLTRALRDAGLDVSQDGLNFSLRGQDRHSGNGQNDPRGGTVFRALQATKAIESMPGNSITYSSAGNARLDIHV